MSGHDREFRLATRGSALARRQAELVRDRLAGRRRSVELIEVETTGDLSDELISELGTTGAFVRDLDRRVLAGDADAAVHSMKDMPTDQAEGLVVAGILERAPAADVLVTSEGTSLEELPAGATVGTASLRRRAQLLARRPDIEVLGLRGNVDTRVEKLLGPGLAREYDRRLAADRAEEADTDEEETDTEDVETAADGDDGDDGEFERSPEAWVESLSPIERRALKRARSEDDTDRTEYDAVCLAEAGLARSDLLKKLACERLDPTAFVPAPAQGAIAVTAPDGETAELIHDAIDHPPTRVAVTVERTILSEIGGGCVAPVGIHARLRGAVVSTTVRVLSRDGTEQIRASRDLPVEDHARAATSFGAELVDRGAAELVAAARREEPDEPKR
ncbi:hydroxymethylbilane synthase [Halobacteriales archaeon QH_10_67_13]|nr:MAG: hydroxymethylbilane synthase [Halobacteriales archaeon QH_10_67_13]